MQKSKDTYRVKSEDIESQTAKRLAKKTDLREQQLVKSLETFKSASWLHQQYKSPRFWKIPKKATDEFEKMKAEYNNKKL